MTRIFLLAGFILVARGAAAQQPHVLERSVRDRWVHEGQSPAFVPFITASTSLHLTVHAFDRTSRYLDLGLSNLALDATNRITHWTLAQPAFSFARSDDALARADTRWRTLRGDGALLSLPAARLWEVPFVVPATPLRMGLAWTDTLSFETEAEGQTERLEGVWHQRVIGDTTIAGRTLPLVQTIAELHYRARELTADAAVDTVIEIVRDVSGTMHGRAAVDTALSVRAAGYDSTQLTGTATLRLGNGTPHVSGVRYDRTRTWLLRDSLTWEAAQDSARLAYERASTGMLILPGEVVERIRNGDDAVVDSLLARWRESNDPDERRRIRFQLRTANDTSALERLRTMQLEAGDTATLIEEALGSLGPRREYSHDLIPYLDDPLRLWKLGVLPRWVYQQLASDLLAATPILQPDSTQWQCAPDVCAAIIAFVDTADELRLRDAALAGAFARDPARWWPRVVARADSGSAIARAAMQLGRGVGATWPASPRAAMPQSGADWRAWLRWMGGDLRFERGHIDALRMYAARTGRDPIAELVRAWPPADDSAYLVIGTILYAMEAVAEPSSGELRAALNGPSEAVRNGAVRQLDRSMRRHARPASEAIASELLEPLIAAMHSGGLAPWPELDGGRIGIDVILSDFHGSGVVPVFILDENLPADVAAAIPDRFTRITRAAWDARPLREGGVLVTLDPVLMWDDFVTVGLDWVAYRRRAADEAPSGYAGGGSFTLLRTPEGWRVVTWGAWIT